MFDGPKGTSDHGSDNQAPKVKVSFKVCVEVCARRPNSRIARLMCWYSERHPRDFKFSHVGTLSFDLLGMPAILFDILGCPRYYLQRVQGLPRDFKF